MFNVMRVLSELLRVSKMKTKFVAKYSQLNVVPSGLTEAGQDNPLRWQLCLPNEKDKCFDYVLPLMKCKDYFNDITYLYTNPESKYAKMDTSVYGMFSTRLPMDALRACEGFYFHLTNLHTKFFTNLTDKLNPFLEETGMPEIVVLDNDETSALIFIDEAYLATTSAISAVTLFIRYINCEHTKGNFQKPTQCATQGYASGQDRQYKDKMVEGIVGKYRWYGPDADCKNQIAMCTHAFSPDKPKIEDYADWYTIHNAGYISALSHWENYLKIKKQQKSAVAA